MVFTIDFIELSITNITLLDLFFWVELTFTL